MENRNEKIKVIYFGNGGEECVRCDDNGEIIKDSFHYFLLEGSKELGSWEIEHFLDMANDILIDKFGIDAQPCQTLMTNEDGDLRSSFYAFEQGIWIRENTSKLLLEANTGVCTLPEAIALWMIMQLGEYLDDYEQIKLEFEASCKDIDRILGGSIIQKSLLYN
ncbi:MAG: hypothetical protein WCF96_05585 [Eubacteriales bacterium]